MTETSDIDSATKPSFNDTALFSFCAISGYFHIASDPEQLRRELSLQGKSIVEDDILRAAQIVGLKARVIEIKNYERLTRVPVPAIAKRKDGNFVIFGGKQASGKYRFVDPVSRQAVELDEAELGNHSEPILILITRKIVGASRPHDPFARSLTQTAHRGFFFSPSLDGGLPEFELSSPNLRSSSARRVLRAAFSAIKADISARSSALVGSVDDSIPIRILNQMMIPVSTKIFTPATACFSL